MKKIFLILTLTLLGFSHAVRAEEPALNMSAFREIPVLQEGRVKPLESFARIYLLAVDGKDALPDQTAIDWLAELLFVPERAYARNVFNIPDPQVVGAIDLVWRTDHHYSFNEVSKALEAYSGTIKTLSEMDDKELTEPQRQLLDLYAKTLAYGVISESVSLLQPRFRIEDEVFAKKLHLPAAQDLNFLDLLPHEAEILASVQGLEHKNPSDLTKQEKESAKLALGYLEISQQRQSALFRIVPPQWRMDNEEWVSPWATLFEGHGSPQSAVYLDMWKNLADAYVRGDAAGWQKVSLEARDKAYELAGTHVSPLRLKAEVFYHCVPLFDGALLFYLVSFACLVTAFLSGRRGFVKAASVFMPMGALLHASGLVLRIFIQNRPPVATLYETTIFVSLIAVVLALIIARKRRDPVILGVGSLIGVVLLFISTRYAADGDTMEMLVAVLNTNFWLATHVVAITTGYGCCLVAGTLGHIYLINRWLRPKDTGSHQGLINSMLAVGLIAAFFALLGTILGGIWADQSWGRFWGWDPKENGAMLIVLWLLWMLHGRVANVLSPLNFATSMAFTNVIVALSWFGVNLLSVGLHSYGFTSHIAANLAGFCCAEIIFTVTLRLLLLRPQLRA